MTQKASHQDIPPTAEIEVENLVLYLTELLNNWDVEENEEEPDTLVRDVQWDALLWTGFCKGCGRSLDISTNRFSWCPYTFQSSLYNRL